MRRTTLYRSICRRPRRGSVGYRPGYLCVCSAPGKLYSSFTQPTGLQVTFWNTVGYNALREIPFPGLAICEWACGIVGRRVVNAEP